ncbi:MAG: FkbM family methyltransferase, partial [Simkaniaceae bacterium]|nr:FkbM family methyltransferase [Simkaniaceae bacterium]
MNLFLKGLCAIAPLLVHSDAIDDFLESYSSSFKDAPVILDCGANQGGSSQVLYNIFPKGEIVAVEADPDVYKQLVKSTENNPSIKAFNYALCKKDGYISFYENENKSKAL